MISDGKITNLMENAERRLEIYKNPREAFEQAISEGRLSRDSNASNYAGRYMYMGPTSDLQHDAFKNIITREYLAVSR